MSAEHPAASTQHRWRMSLGTLQFYLQGHPKPGTSRVRYRPWWVARIGNWISDVRYFWWRLRGGKHYGE